MTTLSTDRAQESTLTHQNGAIPSDAIYLSPTGSALERLAAREVCRYFYMRTGHLLPIRTTVPPPHTGGFWITTIFDAGAQAVLDPELWPTADGFAFSSFDRRGNRLLALVGGSELGALYASYRLAEHLGVRFYLHGDVFPDEPRSSEVPLLDEVSRPLFEVRGVNSWGSHAEGIDLWSEQDWLALVGQLPKLGMNFVGIHGYPEAAGGPRSFIYGAEPWVWVGRPEDVAPSGEVLLGYEASLFSTMRDGWWGFKQKPTSGYRNGADLLFEDDHWGSQVMRSGEASPSEPDQQTAVFNRTGNLLNAVFSLAGRLGVKTALGTETPLIVPRQLREEMGLDPTGPIPDHTVAQLYEGMFSRLARAHPLDFYWIWTPEAWTWRGASGADIAQTVRDIAIALEVAERLALPFEIATTGWVLGPPQDRTLFDRVLPARVPVAEISRIVGRWPLDSAFGQIEGRPKWAIPWLEDDLGLSTPQLWVGRVRRDAADAKRYDCSGLMGLHWRTRVIGPNIAALASAGWSQPWSVDYKAPPEADEGAIGGANRVPMDGSGPQLGPLYGSSRVEAKGYRFHLPDGEYDVALHFIETDFREAGKRRFDVALNGKTAIAKLDIFAEVGHKTPIRRTIDGVVVTHGKLELEFTAHDSLPTICGIEIAAGGGAGTPVRKVNCGGETFGDFAADAPDATQAPDRMLPCGDFYEEWAATEFGAVIAQEAAKIFTAIDGKFPQTSHWVSGAGGIVPDARPVGEADKDFWFIERFEDLRQHVAGPRALERFDYWRNLFCYSRAQGRVACALSSFKQAMVDVGAASDDCEAAALARGGALPSYRDLTQAVDEAFAYFLATISTPGCIGTLLNWEGHILPKVLGETGEALGQALGEPLPADLTLMQGYSGASRLILLPFRSAVGEAETVHLRALVLSSEPPIAVSLFWRPLGPGEFREHPFTNKGRGVFEVELKAGYASDVGVEFFVECLLAGNERLSQPAGAPANLHSVVLAS